MFALTAQYGGSLSCVLFVSVYDNLTITRNVDLLPVAKAPFSTVGLSTVTFLLQSMTLPTVSEKPCVPQAQFDESTEAIHP